MNPQHDRWTSKFRAKPKVQADKIQNGRADARASPEMNDDVDCISNADQPEAMSLSTGVLAYVTFAIIVFVVAALVSSHLLRRD